jgi:hypothetical protein
MNTRLERNRFVTFGRGYPYDLVYQPYQGENGSTGISLMSESGPGEGYEYIFEDNLTYWARSRNFLPHDPAKEVEVIGRRPEQISIGTERSHYYAYAAEVSRESTLRDFIRAYLENIEYILGVVSGRRQLNSLEKQYEREEVLLEILKGRTERELAIFRNYIFARYNYRFQSDEWNLFFRRYYKSDYKGTRSNNKVMAFLTDGEKMVLNLIIQQEEK